MVCIISVLQMAANVSWISICSRSKYYMLMYLLLIKSLLQFIPIIGQALLVGYLSQYFCEKNGLDEELSALRNSNNSELAALKEEEIKIATRDAYLYALGMIVASCTVAVHHTWVFYNSHKIGMMSRIVMTGAIFKKVIFTFISTMI